MPQALANAAVTAASAGAGTLVHPEEPGPKSQPAPG